ncbi:hypothetical protein [Psychromonas aquimarina]|uniref:hypothetical protein n=1 Tax=Psychromonas aquimarina TaxID=444919 RepID=UPI0004032191|nr:hypothetical protein [Psychromonas aquimarina]
MHETINLFAPLLAAIATIASAVAVFKANEIAMAVKNFQKNSILNQRELELIGKALEKLSIYDAWCKPGAKGENVNYHESNESEYKARDEAEIQIPRDIKFILIQLSAHSDNLESQLDEWEENFIIKTGDNYFLDAAQIRNKILSLRSIRSCGL